MNNGTAALNRLKQLTSKGKDKPYSILLHGVEKIGKSTFGASAPDPYFICTEDGLPPNLNHIDRRICEGWEDVIETIGLLINEQHDYKTVVLDTADWAESLIHTFICKRDSKTGIEDYGYGKGHAFASEEARKMLAGFERLMRERSMNIIILAHSQIKTFTNPTGDNYDRYEMKLNKSMAGLLREWPQAVLFAKHEVFVTKDNKKTSKGKAFGGGRVIYTNWNAAWDAGNRFGLPDQLPLSWAVFDYYAKASMKPDPATVEWLVENWSSVEWPAPDAESKMLNYLGITQVSESDLMTCAPDRLKAAKDRLNQFIPQEEAANAVA